MAAAVSPDSILSEVAEVWTALGKSAEGESGAGVLRACSLTLVVVTGDEDDPQQLGETLAALNPEHPSRTIVVRLRASAEPLLAARAFAQCWMPFGQRRQICCEQIEIRVSEASLAEAAPLIEPLIVPDLPVVLWCRDPRIVSLDPFERLAAVAGKLVLDGEQLGDPVAALRMLTALARSRPRVADLAWTRLTRWRELAAQIFENRANLAVLPGVTEVTVSYSGARPPLGGWYLGAWLREGIRLAGGNAAARLVQTAARGGGITGLELLAGGGGSRFSVALSREQVAEIRAGATAHCAALPAAGEHRLMAEELGIAGRDPVFESTLAVAAELALSST